jgi:DNA-binding transcriptional LysR family regulator
MFDWNDMRYFLAVARTGTALGASRYLGVNQTTVSRRIEALEAALGVRLFDRDQGGARLTETGAALLPSAEAAERAASALAEQAAAHARGMAGVVRVTANEAMANLVLAPGLAEFRRRYPDIRVDLVTSDRFLDLENGEADVAIRGSVQLPDSALMARKVASMPWALFCSRDYEQRHGRPCSGEELGRHVLIGGEGGMAEAPAMRWMFGMAPGARVDCRSNSVTNLLHCVKAGLGIAPLPRALAEREADLVRCMPETAFDTTVWVMTTRQLRMVPRIRAFIDFMAPHIVAMTHRMHGSTPQPPPSESE